jgi:hypothetical protein
MMGGGVESCLLDREVGIGVVGRKLRVLTSGLGLLVVGGVV